MADYCGECAVWVGSSEIDRYGRRWCSYSRRYEESNQNTYGCKGFVYNGRTVLTKVCEILDIPTDKWFEAFDAVKEALLSSTTCNISTFCHFSLSMALLYVTQLSGMVDKLSYMFGR